MNNSRNFLDRLTFSKSLEVLKDCHSNILNLDFDKKINVKRCITCALLFWQTDLVEKFLQWLYHRMDRDNIWLGE